MEDPGHYFRGLDLYALGKNRTDKKKCRIIIIIYLLKRKRLPYILKQYFIIQLLYIKPQIRF